jgi:NitT/TauT family transport system substrate-binding protein
VGVAPGLEAGAEVLVDETDLVARRDFVTTHLIVRTDYLREHPQTVRALVEGSVAANARSRPIRGRRRVVGTRSPSSPASPCPRRASTAPWQNITVTDDPSPTRWRPPRSTRSAPGLVEEADLRGIYDLTLLREVLGTDVDDADSGRHP